MGNIWLGRGDRYHRRNWLAGLGLAGHDVMLILFEQEMETRLTTLQVLNREYLSMLQPWQT